MKVLLDTCVWGPATEQLRQLGHDVIWTGDEFPDPGDETILLRAIAEKRSVVTLDKDYGELAVVRDLDHFGIIRIVDASATDHGTLTAAVLDRFAAELRDGAIITVEPGRIRVRPGRGSAGS